MPVLIATTRSALVDCSGRGSASRGGDGDLVGHDEGLSDQLFHLGQVQLELADGVRQLVGIVGRVDHSGHLNITERLEAIDPRRAEDEDRLESRLSGGPDGEDLGVTTSATLAETLTVCPPRVTMSWTSSR